MRDTDLPLFAWQPPCKIVAFPMVARVGKIRDVARKLASKTTDRHADHYVSLITEGLQVQFSKIGIPEHEQDEQIGAFWTKVDQEVARISYRGTGNNPRGAA
ncbi:DUF6074 family protein [Rhizobium ruizarguesonis]|uniref:DUF6074 family protein n=1 Tax=Rhizobium ruizarguesonis TaxID=2081791 RepID=UPI0013BBE433|nr:DUF6074 family protein [Rhizobium ruizarguesonis]NEJ57500.1 hypothetical protein [Rhizobium ruizarguesonis]NEJ64917.1 hypothetical protein [Rhizobium ruizarguesonis]